MITGAMADERKLLDAYVREKDEAAFAELVRRHEGMMQAAAYRICGDSQEALDAIQRALIAFARRAGEVRADHGVGPWLHRATTLEAMALRRQRLKRREREKQAMEHQQLDKEGMPSEVAAELDGAINSLHPKDRAAIVLHFFEGLTFGAIAVKLGGTEAAWQKRGVRALDKLSAMLRRRGVVATGTALGAWLIAGRVEAAVPAGAFATMMREALHHPLTASVPLSSSPIILLIMKTKIALAVCFLGGAILSYSWSENAKSGVIASQAPSKAALSGDSAKMTEREPRGFRLESIASAVSYLDSQEKFNNSAESQLRALMFSVPEEYLDDVHGLLLEVENQERFQEIAAAFFARSAEIDPEAAWLMAQEEEMYTQPARRGVMLTWLHSDPDAALEILLETKLESDINILAEYVRGMVQHAPRRAAELVDRVGQSWPEADKRLFRQVAQDWAMVEPEAAGEWIASHWDEDAKNYLLLNLAYQVSRERGNPGMEMASLIEDPTKRDNARQVAARWWGVSLAGPSLDPDWGDPNHDMGHGFPVLTEDEIESFARGTMVNYAQYYPELLAHAKNEAQRQAVYRGVIDGSVYSDPSNGAGAVQYVDADYAQTPEGKSALEVFIQNWNELDPEATTTWLNAQPDDAKTRVMRSALE